MTPTTEQIKKMTIKVNTRARSSSDETAPKRSHDVEGCPKFTAGDCRLFSTLKETHGPTLRVLLSHSEQRTASRLVRLGVITKGTSDERGSGRVIYYFDRLAADQKMLACIEKAAHNVTA